MKEDKYKDSLKLITVPIWIYCSLEMLYGVLYFILDILEQYDVTAVMAEFSLVFSILTLYFVLPAAALISLLYIVFHYSVKTKSIKPLLNARFLVTIVIIIISTMCRLEVMSNNF